MHIFIYIHHIRTYIYIDTNIDPKYMHMSIYYICKLYYIEYKLYIYIYGCGQILSKFSEGGW